MEKSLSHFRLSTLEGLLGLLWSQWTTLGVRGTVPPVETWVLDPEALVLFTCSIGRYDPRLFDAMLEWLAEHQRFVNVQRLRTINRRHGFGENRLLAAIAGLLKTPVSKAKWEKLGADLAEGSYREESLFMLKNGSPHPGPARPDEAFGRVGLSRHEYRVRGTVRQFDPDRRANLIMKLRTLIGVSSRCEVLAYLLTHSEANPTEIAARVGYSTKTIHNTVSEMYLSGTLFRRTRGRETLFRLDMDSWKSLLRPVGSSAEWMDWPCVYRNLEKFWHAIDTPEAEGERSRMNEDQLKLAFHELVSALRGMPDSIPDSLTVGVRPDRLGLQDICGVFNRLMEHLAR